MSLSSNNFAKDQPTKSANAFALDNPTQSANTFASNKPTKNSDIPTGDNITSGSVYGGDFSTYGNQYGDSIYTGISHFLKRTENTPSH